jgi:hypothetical protein
MPETATRKPRTKDALAQAQQRTRRQASKVKRIKESLQTAQNDLAALVKAQRELEDSLMVG